MATQSLGKVMITPRGDWNISTVYRRLDLVTYQGGSYICTADNTVTIPGTQAGSSSWQVVAAPSVNPSDFANGVKNTVGPGETLTITDVSPIPSLLSIRVFGENLLPWPKASGAWSVNENGSLTATKTSTAGSLKDLVIYTGETALPVGEYRLICEDGVNKSNSARINITKTDGTTVGPLHAYGETVAEFSVDETVTAVRVSVHCIIIGETTFSPVLSRLTAETSGYVSPIKWETVTVNCAESRQSENPQTASTDENGFTNELSAVYPRTVVWATTTDSSAGNPSVQMTYLQDTASAIDGTVHTFSVPFSLEEGETYKTLQEIQADGIMTETSGTAVASVNLVYSDAVASDVMALSSCVVLLSRNGSRLYPVVVRPGIGTSESLAAVTGTVNVVYGR